MGYKLKTKPKIKAICEKRLRLKDWHAIAENLIKEARHSLPATRLLLSILQQEDGGDTSNANKNGEQAMAFNSKDIIQMLNEEENDDEK